MPKTQGAASAASTLGSMIPGLGWVAGIPALAGGILGLFASNKNPYDEQWLKRQKDSINAEYDKSLGRAKGTAYNLFDSTIGETANKAGMAGGVAGINNPQRLLADAYSKIAGQRDSSVASITNALEQNRAAMQSAVERQYSDANAQFEMNSPNILDRLTPLTNVLGTELGQNALAGIVGGVGSLFQGSNTVNKKYFGTTPKVNRDFLMQDPMHTSMVSNPIERGLYKTTDFEGTQRNLFSSGVQQRAGLGGFLKFNPANLGSANKSFNDPLNLRRKQWLF